MFVQNEGSLSAAFSTLMQEKLIEKRGDLDIVSLADPTISSALAQASNMNALHVAQHFVKVITSAFALWTQLTLWRSLRRTRRLLPQLGLSRLAVLAALIQYLRWFYLAADNSRSAATNSAYMRLSELWGLSCQEGYSESSVDMKLLYTKEYLLHNFRRARQQLGSAAFIRDRGRSHLLFAFDTFAHLWPVALRCAYALRNGQHQKSVSQLSITIMCARRMASTLSDLASAVDDIRRDCVNIRSYYQALDVEPLVRETASPVSYRDTLQPERKGMHVVFEDVSFGYSGPHGPQAIKDVSFDIQPGSLVCIVGGNGAGKSTLLKVLTRLYDPSSGRVLINGVCANRLPISDLRKNIAVQLQRTARSNVTIAEFVWLGRASDEPEAPLDVEAVRSALDKAGAMSFIDKLDKGIWSRLGPYPPRTTPEQLLSDAIAIDEAVFDEWAPSTRLEASTSMQVGGNKGKRDTSTSCEFSGGEWARLCHARTLIQDADLFVFDDPAAPLDALAAEVIFRNIEEMRGKKTVLHITHHLRSVIGADQILCFDQGALVESGTHQELMDRAGGYYRSLVVVQMPELLEPRSVPVDTPSEAGSVDSGYFDLVKEPR